MDTQMHLERIGGKPNQNRAHTVQYLSEIVLLLAIVIGRLGNHRVGVAALGHRQTLPHVGSKRLSGCGGGDDLMNARDE